MILTCPECSTRYLVAAQSIGADGRRVRCARCGHTWFHQPEEDLPPEADDLVMPPPEETSAPQSESVSVPAIQGESRSFRMTPAQEKGLAYVAGISVTAACLIVLPLFVPLLPSQTPAEVPVQIENLKASILPDEAGKGHVIELKGDIAELVGQAEPPLAQVQLLSAEGRTVAKTRLALTLDRTTGEEKVPFMARVPVADPSEAATVSVTFDVP